MKPFSIRKIPNPSSMKSAGTNSQKYLPTNPQFGMTGMNMNGSNNGTAFKPHTPSLLTTEEQEALKPHEVKVDNPWIYEQTHKEYLDNIKGLPARHAKVITKHHDV